MINISNLVESGANIKIEVSPEDLKMFAESVVERTITAHAQAMEQKAPPVEETYLNTKQVRERLNVCEGTLNTWAKRCYLVPVKVGNKNMYALSDVHRIQHGNRSETVTEYCKRSKTV
jgi:predicted ATPase